MIEVDSLNGYTGVFRGPAHELAGFSSEGQEVDGLVDWLRADKVQGTQLSDVGILLRTNSQIDHLAPKLSVVSIENIRLRPNMADDRGQPGVRLSTVHRCKGLGIPGRGDPVPVHEPLDPALNSPAEIHAELAEPCGKVASDRSSVDVFQPRYLPKSRRVS